jgi:hypothetical protein
LYGGAWLSGAGATYYGAPNGDGSDGQYSSVPFCFISSPSLEEARPAGIDMGSTSGNL